MATLDFIKSNYDDSLHIRTETGGGMTIIGAYVDDMLIAGTFEKEMGQVGMQIEVHVELRIEDSATKFLGKCVNHDATSGS